MGNAAYEQNQARKVKARLRMLQHAQRVSGNVSHLSLLWSFQGALLHLEEALRKERLSWPSRPEAKAAPHPVPDPSGDRFPDSPDSGRAPLRSRANEPVLAAALSCVRFADHYSQALSSSPRRPDLTEEVPPWPEAS